MNEVLVSLAIQLEERFRISICYFRRAPMREHAKSDIIFVLHESKKTDLFLVEVLRRTGTGSPEDLATEVYDFLHDVNLRLETTQLNAPTRHVSFLNSEEIPPQSQIDGFSGFAFTSTVLHPAQKLKRAA